jgi:glycosyltransferase involved in cell wall biosynthesis
MIDSITAIGDVSDINCWSGIPYYFWQAALRQGWKTEPIRVRLERAKWLRRSWNAKQCLRGRGPGGFQYSEEFANWAWQFFPDTPAAPHILSFHPFIPSLSRLRQSKGQLSLYFDATHPLMFARYNLGQSVSLSMRQYILEAERKIYHEAARLVFFQRWAAESAVRDCGADPAKVSVILPGANFELPASFRFHNPPDERGTDRPFYFGYVGKDWRRKGFRKLLATVEVLNRMGLAVRIHCIGLIPDDAQQNPYVRYHGFLDKRLALQNIIDIMASCDLGCLLSDAEASSIAVLEFLRVGVPVMATAVDGMEDLIPPDAGLRIDRNDPPETIAERLAVWLRSPDKLMGMRARAQQWSARVTWDRCLQEWAELLQTGRVNNPVQPWKGLVKHDLAGC